MKSLLLFCCILFMNLLTGCYEQGYTVKSIEEVVSEFNKKCPRMVDSETRIDGIGIRGKNTVVYKYTLVNVLARNVDTLAFRQAAWLGILSLIKVSPDLKELRDQQTRFEYCYNDKLNTPIYTFKIYPKDYNP